MRSLLESPRDREGDQNSPETPQWDRAVVLEELDRILSSPSFKSADRSREFLRHVVLNKLDGHTERLKERVIGSDLFHRPPGYATGDDPVVRVQAGEVRRRLQRYYQSAALPPPLRIELPVGSYSPVFHPGSVTKPPEIESRPAVPAVQPPLRRKGYIRAASLLALVIVGAFLVTALLNSDRHADPPKSTLDQFWAPAAASHQPILICLANASKNDTGQPPALAPSNVAQDEAGQASTTPAIVQTADRELVPAGDASVAIALSGLFGRLDRPSQLRIGAAATYEDLRDFPAVVIGGFNNKWTMQLLSNVHFAFVWDHGQYTIREQIPGGRFWTTNFGPNGEPVKDFAIVSRLIDSKTGQFTVIVAGIGPRGTQAAGEFVSSPRYLEEGLATAPAHWQNRNLEILLETAVTDSVAGPPHVVAQYAW